MKRFVFSLQSLYDIKKAVEGQQKLQMKTLEARLAALQTELADTRSQQAQTRHRFQQEMAGGISPTTLEQYEGYFNLLEMAQAMLLTRIAGVEGEKRLCLAAQLETRRELKSLEKLWQAEHEAYRVEVRQEEEKAINDIVTYRVATT